MGKPLDEMYFNWLYRQVGDPSIKNPTRTYWRLLKALYVKEFVFIVKNDDNRVADGTALRYEFLDSTELNDVDPGWVNLGCSMFELVIGLSRRLSFQAEGESRDWFWRMMENVDLSKYNDSYEFEAIDHEHINCILDEIIWRTYRPNGYGGLFPLANPPQDQRDVELWYQLSAYILEVA